jgi:hypothetical protein
MKKGRKKGAEDTIKRRKAKMKEMKLKERNNYKMRENKSQTGG